jgi:2-hydroxychromene-2-carboxylate isomerase
VNAARATLWAQRHAPHQAVPLIHALYDEIFRYGQDITRAESVGAIAEKTGINGQQVMEAIKTPELKDQLKTRNEEVLRQGIFGSPFMIVDEEPFWGADRLDMMDQWLRQGGW